MAVTDQSITDTSPAPPSRPVGWVLLAVLLIFFSSGACALIYETVWQKMLCLVFGITTYATTTILAAFMGGLALGSFAFGRYADRCRRPLRVYAYLELGVGVFALVFPFVLTGITAVFTGISRQWQPSEAVTGLIRFALCVVILAIPAVLMGGTLPVMSKYYVRHIRVVGVGTGTLYGLNTLGGVAGCFLAGFVLMVAFGTRATLYGAAAANLALAALALVIDRAYPSLGPAVEEGDRAEPRAVSSETTGEADARITPGVLTFRLLLIASGVTGFCALAYEVLWTRTLGVFLHSSVYAFPTMLTSFLCGSALGSLLYAKVLDRVRSSTVLLGIVQLLIGVTAVLTIFEFRYLGEVTTLLGRRLGPGWNATAGAGFVASFLVMLVPSVLMGIALPLVIKAFTRSIAQLGRSVGSLYSANTFGCVLGATLAGFVVIPFIGVVRGIVLVAALNAALGMLLLVSAPGARRTRWVALAAAAAVLPVVGYLGLTWRVPVTLYSQKHARVINAGDKVLFYRDGVDGTVTVTRRAHHPFDGISYRTIEVDGVDVAGDLPDLRTTQKIQGHIPLLLFKATTGRDPDLAFILGLGTGEASSCIARHQVRRVDCAELVGAEVGANHFFREINGGILDNPRFNLVVNDARNHLLTTSESYDIIQSDSVHPVIAFNTYTKEYYELCRRRLSDEGVFSTWIPLFNFTEDNMKTLIRTMLEVFPHVSVWWAPNFDNKHAILVGMNHELRIDYRLLKEEIEKPTIQASLAEVHLEKMANVLGSFVADEKVLSVYAEGAALNTDDNLLLPYGIPKNPRQGQRTVPENMDAFAALTSSILPYVGNLSPAEREEIGIDRHYVARGHVMTGMSAFYRSLEDGSDEGFVGAARQWTAALRANPGDAAVERLLSEARFFRAVAAARRLDSAGRHWEALARYRVALRVRPGNPFVHLSMAASYDAVEAHGEALQSLTRALESAPDYVAALNKLALHHLGAGNIEGAEQALRKALESSPHNAEARQISRLIERRKAS